LGYCSDMSVAREGFLRQAVWVSVLLAVGAALVVRAPAAKPDTGTLTGKITLVRLPVGSAVNGFDDVVVYLEDAPTTGKMPRGPFRIIQRNKTFEPKVTVVPRGERVEFPNEDKLQHNVFSLAPEAKFDLGLYRRGESRTVKFDKPGVVPIFCNIHPQMAAYVVVVDNPFFARPRDGRFSLKGIRPGTYTAVAWFPHGKALRQQVKVMAGATTRIELLLTEQRGAQRHQNKHGKTYSRY
jgi:plastocyanin